MCRLRVPVRVLGGCVCVGLFVVGVCSDFLGVVACIAESGVRSSLMCALLLCLLWCSVVRTVCVSLECVSLVDVVRRAIIMLLLVGCVLLCFRLFHLFLFFLECCCCLRVVVVDLFPLRVGIAVFCESLVVCCCEVSCVDCFVRALGWRLCYSIVFDCFASCFLVSLFSLGFGCDVFFMLGVGFFVAWTVCLLGNCSRGWSCVCFFFLMCLY